MVASFEASLQAVLRRSSVLVLGTEVGVCLLDDGRTVVEVSAIADLICDNLAIDVDGLATSSVVAGRVDRAAFRDGFARFPSQEGCHVVGLEVGTLDELLDAWIAVVEAGVRMNRTQRLALERCRALHDALGAGGAVGIAREAVGDPEVAIYEVTLPDGTRRRIFPLGLWSEFARLTGRPMPKHGTPPWWGKLVNWTIYDTLDAETNARIAEIRSAYGTSWHRRAPDEPAVRAVADRCREVLALAVDAVDDYDLRRRVNEHFGRGEFQMDLVDILGGSRSSERSNRLERQQRRSSVKGR